MSISDGTSLRDRFTQTRIPASAGDLRIPYVDTGSTAGPKTANALFGAVDIQDRAPIYHSNACTGRFRGRKCRRSREQVEDLDWQCMPAYTHERAGSTGRYLREGHHTGGIAQHRPDLLDKLSAINAAAELQMHNAPQLQTARMRHQV